MFCKGQGITSFSELLKFSVRQKMVPRNIRNLNSKTFWKEKPYQSRFKSINEKLYIYLSCCDHNEIDYTLQGSNHIWASIGSVDQEYFA